MFEYYEKVKDIFHGFDYSRYKSESQLERARVIIEGMDFIFNLDNKEIGVKKKFIDLVTGLAKAHSLCITSKEDKL